MERNMDIIDEVVFQNRSALKQLLNLKSKILVNN